MLGRKLNFEPSRLAIFLADNALNIPQIRYRTFDVILDEPIIVRDFFVEERNVNFGLSIRNRGYRPILVKLNISSRAQHCPDHGGIARIGVKNLSCKLVGH